jgi:Outer membrane lipoprotein-sorting protein
LRRAAALPVAVLLIAAAAHAADARTVLARVRQNIETADYRATGKLVRVDPGGQRISDAITIKAHWFPGILRALVEIVPPPGVAANPPQQRVRILFELRPNGQNVIRIARPNGPGLVPLPFEKWGEPLFGGQFSYEDLLESQYYWQGQTIVKSARFGARDCDVLKSTPGAADHTHYAEVETWLDHVIDYPVYAEKTLKDGAAVKQFTYFGLRKSGGVWSATQVEAKVRGRLGSTLLIVERGSTRANLTAKDFSPEQISHFEVRP